MASGRGIGALRTEPPFRKVPLGGARGVVGVWDQGRLVVTKTTKQRYEGGKRSGSSSDRKEEIGTPHTNVVERILHPTI